MTPLTAVLMQRIAETGPMTIADFMVECLMHPTHGYYSTRDPFGASGDFTTSPEISQMFGELLGLALVQAWMDQGQPEPIVLTELGPGRGTCMADILRATRAIPGFAKAVDVHLVEASQVLRQTQRKTIKAPITHHDTIASLPEAPLFLLANEFFDALPIRQYVRDGVHWRERVVGVEDGRLVFGLSDPTAPKALYGREDVADGQMVEICPALTPIVGEISRRIAAHGGAAIIVDYGDWQSLGDTLQALKAHKVIEPLAAPGSSDLTAHVDFAAISHAAAPAKATRMIPQGTLLGRLGIAARAETLTHNLTGLALSSHNAAYRRLTSPEEMGNLFKTIAIHPDGIPAPPGFDP